MKMKMEVMSTHSAALQHPTPPPSHCPGDTDTSLIADISHKQKIGLWSTFCHLLIIRHYGKLKICDYSILYCWKVEAVMLMILSVGESRPRLSCRVMADSRLETPASVRICTLQTREHQLGVWFSSSKSQLLKLKLNTWCIVCIVEGKRL